jgi:hypothetical protein
MTKQHARHLLNLLKNKFKGRTPLPEKFTLHRDMHFTIANRGISNLSVWKCRVTQPNTIVLHFWGLKSSEVVTVSMSQNSDIPRWGIGQ